MGEVIEKSKPVKSGTKQDRSTLLPQVAKKVDGWISQINEKLSGAVSVTRSDLVNFFLEKLPDVLNKDQIEKIRDAHFDEVRFAQWALQQIKDSKKKGEPLTLKDVINMSKVVDSDVAKKTKKPKGAESKADPAENLDLEDISFDTGDSAKP